VESKVFFKNSKRVHLCGLINVPKNAIEGFIVIFVHGHSSSKNTKNFIRLTEMLDKAGVSTFRIDIHGHGESGGDFSETTVSEAVDDILQAIEYIKGLEYRKIGLLGSSFGGIASIITASKSKDLSFLILKSPVSNYKDKYNDLEGKKFVNDWKNKGERDYDASEGKILKLKYLFYEDAIRYDGYKVAPAILIPILIVHGDEDEAVPVEQSIKIASLFPNCRLEIIKGSDHRYVTKIMRNKC
jgi:alpha/beta superfamily hydrolase